MSRSRTVVVTGSASGMGAATRELLEADGQRVIGVDLDRAEIIADLGTADGRLAAVTEITDLAEGVLDALVTWAGVPGLSDAPGSDVVSVNHFGAVAMLEGLRPLLARGDRPAAVAISSNSTTIQPGIPTDVVHHCLAGDEPAARGAADAAGGLSVYPASKLALTRWVRRNATTGDWAGTGITLNAVAPGAIETPLLDATRRDPVVGEFVDALPIPLGRTGQAGEVAEFVMFLLGPHARFFCGSVLFVDGGSDALLAPDRTPQPMT